MRREHKEAMLGHRFLPGERSYHRSPKFPLFERLPFQQAAQLLTRFGIPMDSFVKKREQVTIM